MNKNTPPPVKQPVYIIGEIGVNHNGDRELAFQLVDVAFAAGVDAVKFQTFNADLLVTQNAEKANYQKQTTDTGESQYQMIKGLELSHDLHHELACYCREKGVQFLSSAFDLESLDFLVNDLGLKTLKVPSGEITNGPLLLAHARSGCDLIVSTGMTTLADIKEALGVLAFGFIGGEKPSKVAFLEAYSSPAGQSALKKKITLLHCTTEYPAPVQDINLNALTTMRNTFDLNIGYSDHSEGIAVPIAAVALGATVIEKHITLDKTLPGPDHIASMEPRELITMVNALRQVEQALGDGIKRLMPSEISNRDIARKSLVAAKNIAQGEMFSPQNLTTKRPGTGMSPMEYWDLIGKTSKQPYKSEDIIS